MFPHHRRPSIDRVAIPIKQGHQAVRVLPDDLTPPLASSHLELRGIAKASCQHFSSFESCENKAKQVRTFVRWITFLADIDPSEGIIDLSERILISRTRF